MTTRQHCNNLPPTYYALHSLREPRPSAWPVPRAFHSEPDQGALCVRPSGVPRGYAAGGHAVHLSAVLPPAEAQEEGGRQEAALAAGCHAPPDHSAGVHAAAGLADAGAHVCGLDDAWEQLLAQLRGPAESAAQGEEQARLLVGSQPQDGVLCPQDHGEVGQEGGVLINDSVGNNLKFSGNDPNTTGNKSALKTLWVVNSEDFIDVEYVLRKLMRCDSTDCHPLHSIGYVFFRSCVLSHVNCPGDYLQAGMLHRFPESEVVIEVLQAAPEGVVELACYLEYVP